jgi:hypothetical protein
MLKLIMSAEAFIQELEQEYLNPNAVKADLQLLVNKSRNLVNKIHGAKLIVIFLNDALNKAQQEIDKMPDQADPNQ